MSQIELGKALGAGNVTISQYEKGTRKPDNEMLVKIANFFGVSIDYLLGSDAYKKSTTSFGQNLKKMRKQHGVTQGELANIVGIEKSSVSKYETANVIPSIDILKKIASVFNVSVDYLLGSEEQQKSTNEIPIESASTLSQKKQELLELLPLLSDEEVKKMLEIYTILKK